MATMLRQTLSPLSQLERLDLSNSRLKNKLSVVLGGLSGHLKHLRLSGCGLTSLDISALARLGQANKLMLEELDLSENRLGPAENGNQGGASSLLQLLGTANLTLRVLELQACNLDEDQGRGLATLLARMNQLIFLNLQANPWPSACTMEVAGRFMSQSTGLHVLQMSYPPDCYPSFEDEDHLDLEGELKARFHVSLNKLSQNSRSSLKLLISDMDHTMIN